MKHVNKKIAIYPGSFNPFTIGHLNILEKAEAIFGEGNVIISVGVNPEKVKNAIAYTTSGVIFGANPIIEDIKINMPSKKVEGYIGFLTDYVWEKEKAGYDVTIVKGLRNGDDLDYEVNQLRFMEEMKPDIKVIFITCDKQFEHVSSSAYRMLEAVRPGAGHRYLGKETDKQTIEGIMCNVFVIEGESDISKKYDIHYNIKKYGNLTDKKADFYGTYAKCLVWIKEQESKK